jgi:hypothetical protein
MEMKEASLSPANPTLRVSTGVGALECGAGCQVLYDWDDEEYKSTSAAKKNRPPVSVKFGTQEKGLNVRGENEEVPPGPSRFGWELGAHLPMGADTDKKVTVTKVHFVALVTLNQPLVKLPGKAPTIRLPFIGTTLIGPSPGPVRVNVTINYYKPL